jgi:aspartate aminotransferase-like enzyme/GNAT superfamily N-acetyltransferase
LRIRIRPIVTGGSAVRFEVAGAATDFEQIFRLGYETFVDEIPQHPANAERRHVDRFHAENTYLVAKVDNGVVGMLAVRGNRPFSLDQKLGSVDPYLPAGRRVCELRLLAVRPEYRGGWVFKGLVDLLLDHGRARGFDLAIISGTLRQEKLYRHLGFVPFGPLVGTDEAPFQPMYLPIERLAEAAPILAAPQVEPLSFLPGPVPVSCAVRAAFESPAISHRCAAFHDLFGRVRGGLRRLTGGRHVQVLLGSGTLANDVVAAQLSLRPGPGVVLSNGEFGDRLIDHARRHRLRHEPITFGWGEPLDLDRVADAVKASRARWLWAVASETSTGMLNDVGGLQRIAADLDADLCLDAVSAVGAVPLEFDDVAFASVTSGKALGALPGLSAVVHRDAVHDAAADLPRYLDLGYYAAHDGVPFTHSSNLVAALGAALDRFDSASPFRDLARTAEWFRPRLRAAGFLPLVDDAHATPAVVTLPAPDGLSAEGLGASLERHGLHVAYRSGYLRSRNWLQVALMGACTRAHLERLLEGLRRARGFQGS